MNRFVAFYLFIMMLALMVIMMPGLKPAIV